MGIASKRRTTVPISKGCAMPKTAWIIGLAASDDDARTRPVHQRATRTSRVPAISNIAIGLYRDEFVQ
jgi:hypothetical protein